RSSWVRCQPEAPMAEFDEHCGTGLTLPPAHVTVGVSNLKLSSRMLLRFTVVFVAAVGVLAAQGDARSSVAERVMKLTREAAWKPVSSIPIDFPTHHPQGMVKIGDTFYVSSVEIKIPTTHFPKPV